MNVARIVSASILSIFLFTPLVVFSGEAGVVVPIAANGADIIRLPADVPELPSSSSFDPTHFPALESIVEGQLLPPVLINNQHVEVTQITQDVVANFHSFNIKEGCHLNLIQPNKDANAFFRVTGNTGISRIDGFFTANGNVYLLTPNGLLIGERGMINMNSFLATTHSDFQRGVDAEGNRFIQLYNIPNPEAIISNRGTIMTTGFAGLVAPTVRNAGVIQGNIFVSAGERTDLSFEGSDLIQMRVSGTLKKSLIEQTGTGKLGAKGKTVVIKASDVEEAANNVINWGGETIGTEILIEGGDNSQVTIKSNALLDATGDMGGTIGVLGDFITLEEGVIVDASGNYGGGRILIGGESRGKGLGRNAKAVVVKDGASLYADSIISGNAGEIIHYADVAKLWGRASASAFGDTGDAGFIEYSGKKYLRFAQDPDHYPKLFKSKEGKSGTFLIDPDTLTLSNTSQTVTYNFGNNDGTAHLSNALGYIQIANDRMAEPIPAAALGAWLANYNVTLIAGSRIFIEEGGLYSGTYSNILTLTAGGIDSGGSFFGTIDIVGFVSMRGSKTILNAPFINFCGDEYQKINGQDITLKSYFNDTLGPLTVTGLSQGFSDVIMGPASSINVIDPVITNDPGGVSTLSLNSAGPITITNPTLAAGSVLSINKDASVGTLIVQTTGNPDRTFTWNGLRSTQMSVAGSTTLNAADMAIIPQLLQDGTSVEVQATAALTIGVPLAYSSSASNTFKLTAPTINFNQSSTASNLGNVILNGHTITTPGGSLPVITAQNVTFDASGYTSGQVQSGSFSIPSLIATNATMIGRPAVGGVATAYMPVTFRDVATLTTIQNASFAAVQFIGNNAMTFQNTSTHFNDVVFNAAINTVLIKTSQLYGHNVPSTFNSLTTALTLGDATLKDLMAVDQVIINNPGVTNVAQDLSGGIAITTSNTLSTKSLSGQFSLMAPQMVFAPNTVLDAAVGSSLQAAMAGGLMSMTTQLTIKNLENITFTNQSLSPTAAGSVLNLLTDATSYVFPPSTGTAFGTVNVSGKTASTKTISTTFSAIPLASTFNFYGGDANVTNTSQITFLNTDFQNQPTTINFPYTLKLNNPSNVAGLTLGSQLVKVAGDLASNGSLNFGNSRVQILSVGHETAIRTTAGYILIDQLLFPETAGQNFSISANGALSIRQREMQAISFGEVTLSGQFLTVAGVSPGIGLKATIIDGKATGSSIALTHRYQAPKVILTGVGVTFDDVDMPALSSLALTSTGDGTIRLSQPLLGDGTNTSVLSITSAGAVDLYSNLGGYGQSFGSVSVTSGRTTTVQAPISIYAKTVSFTANDTGNPLIKANIDIQNSLTVMGDGTGTLAFTTPYDINFNGALAASLYTTATFEAGGSFNINGNLAAPTLELWIANTPSVRVLGHLSMTAKKLVLNNSGRLTMDAPSYDLGLTVTDTTSGFATNLVAQASLNQMVTTARNLRVVTASDLSVDASLTTNGTIDLTSGVGKKIALSTSTMTSNGTITFHSPVSVTGATTITTGGAGDILFNDVIQNSTDLLTLTAAGHKITVQDVTANAFATNSATLLLGSGNIQTVNNLTVQGEVQLTNATHRFTSAGGNILFQNGSSISRASGAGTLELSATSGTVTLPPYVKGTNPMTVKFLSGMPILSGGAINSAQSLILQATTGPIYVNGLTSYTTTGTAYGLTLQSVLAPQIANIDLTLNPQGPLVFSGNTTGTLFRTLDLSTGDLTQFTTLQGDVASITTLTLRNNIRLAGDRVLSSGNVGFTGTPANTRIDSDSLLTPRALTINTQSNITLPTLGATNPLRSLTVTAPSKTIGFSGAIYATDRTLNNANGLLYNIGVIDLTTAHTSFRNGAGIFTVISDGTVTLGNMGQTTPLTTIDLSGITTNVTLANLKASSSILLPDDLDIPNTGASIEAASITFNSNVIQVNDGNLILRGIVDMPYNTTFSHTGGGSLSFDGSLRSTGALTLDLPLILLNDFTLDSDSIHLRDSVSGHHYLTIRETAGFDFTHDLGVSPLGVPDPLRGFEWHTNKSLRGRIAHAIHADIIKLWTPDMAFGPGHIYTPHLQIIPMLDGYPEELRGVSIENDTYAFQVWSSLIADTGYFTIGKMSIGDPQNPLPMHVNGSLRVRGLKLVLYGDPIYVGLGLDEVPNIDYRGTIKRDKHHNDLWNEIQEFKADYHMDSMERLLAQVSLPETMPMVIVPLDIPSLSQNSLSSHEEVTIGTTTEGPDDEESEEDDEEDA